MEFFRKSFRKEHAAVAAVSLFTLSQVDVKQQQQQAVSKPALALPMQDLSQYNLLS